MISEILTRLRPRFRRLKVDPERPLLGLDPDQIRTLSAAVQHPGWKHYHKALEWVWGAECEALLQGLPHDEYLKKVGLLAGLRRAAALPDELAAMSDRLKVAQHERTESTREHASSRLARFFGTPFWHGASEGVESPRE